MAPPDPKTPVSGYVAPVLLVALFVVVVMLFRAGQWPSDFAAVYFAGLFFAEGQTELVYVLDTHIGDLPEAWFAPISALGYEGGIVYRFIYPPLWAASAAPISVAYPPDAVFDAALPVLAACMGLSAVVALRIVPVTGSRPVWLFVLLILLLFGREGQFSIQLGQPQILVGLLILLAFERSFAGRDRQAGLALALAAALKLYPAVFVLWWVAERRWSAVVSFALSGAVLAGLSVFLAGWPLHLEFLDELSISRGFVHGNPVNFNLQSALYQLTHGVELARDPLTGAVSIFRVPEPGWITLTVPLCLLIGLVVIARRWHAGSAQWRLAALFPASLILVSLCLPLGWTHQFLPAILVLPALTVLYGPRLGGSLILVFAVATSSHVFRALAPVVADVIPNALFGTAGFVALFLVFVSAPVPPAMRRAGHGF